MSNQTLRPANAAASAMVLAVIEAQKLQALLKVMVSYCNKTGENMNDAGKNFEILWQLIELAESQAEKAIGMLDPVEVFMRKASLDELRRDDS